jgi:hypothetical protein
MQRSVLMTNVYLLIVIIHSSFRFNSKNYCSLKYVLRKTVHIWQEN